MDTAADNPFASPAGVKLTGFVHVWFGRRNLDYALGTLPGVDSLDGAECVLLQLSDDRHVIALQSDGTAARFPAELLAPRGILRLDADSLEIDTAAFDTFLSTYFEALSPSHRRAYAARGKADRPVKTLRGADALAAGAISVRMLENFWTEPRSMDAQLRTLPVMTELTDTLQLLVEVDPNSHVPVLMRDQSIARTRGISITPRGALLVDARSVVESRDPSPKEPS